MLNNTTVDNNGTFNSTGSPDGGGIFSYSDVSVYGSTISNNFVLGSGADGADLNVRGDLLVVSSTIDGNDNNGSGGADGGGIYGHYAGSLTIVSSTISNNTVHQSSGQGGGVAVKSDVLIVNSTFSGNRTFGSGGHGGALYIYDNSGSNEAARIYSSTFSGNSVHGSSANAGGIWARDSPLYVTNSIILGNYARFGYAGDQEIDLSSTSLNFQGSNIVCQMPYAFQDNYYSNVQNGNPFLVFQDLEVNGFWLAGALADNGGLVETIALRETVDNPAFDASYSFSLPTDTFDLDNDGNTLERLPVDARGPGFLRDSGGSSNVVMALDKVGAEFISHASIDLGAFEIQIEKSLVVDTADDVVDPFDGVTSLREAINYVNDGSLYGTITFDGSVFNGEAQDIIRLSNGHLQVYGGISIDGDINGDGTPDVVISGDRFGNDITNGTGITDIGASRSGPSPTAGSPYAGALYDNTRHIFEVRSGYYAKIVAKGANTAADLVYLSPLSADFNGLILTGGYSEDGTGGAIYSELALNVTNSWISGNRSHTPHRLQTTLTPAQEAVAVALRKTLLVSLDDLLAVVREFLNPNASRSGLDRCLRRHGVGPLRALKAASPRPKHSAFKAYEPGSIPIDLKYLPPMADESRRRSLFVAIDRATRWVVVRVYNSKTHAPSPSDDVDASAGSCRRGPPQDAFGLAG